MSRPPWFPARTSRSAVDPAPWLAVVTQPDMDRATAGLPGLSREERRRLRVAMLEDTVAALTRAERIRAVMIVWEHPADLQEMHGHPQVMHLVAQRREVDQAIAGVEQQLQSWVRPVGRVVIIGSRPACNRREVDRLLDQAAATPRCLLPDPHGRRAAVVTARAGITLPPDRDGDPDLSGRHRTGRSRTLQPCWLPSLARDIATLDDLHQAVRLGVGPATLAVARELQLVDTELRPRPSATGRGAGLVLVVS